MGRENHIKLPLIISQISLIIMITVKINPSGVGSPNLQYLYMHGGRGSKRWETPVLAGISQSRNIQTVCLRLGYTQTGNGNNLFSNIDRCLAIRIGLCECNKSVSAHGWHALLHIHHRPIVIGIYLYLVVTCV